LSQQLHCRGQWKVEIVDDDGAQGCIAAGDMWRTWLYSVRVIGYVIATCD